jgi:hypothetical protein
MMSETVRMAVVTISGEPASRWEEVAHAAARLLDFDLVTESRLEQWMLQEFGDADVPARAWRPAAQLVLSRMAAERSLLVAANGAEYLFGAVPFSFRIHIAAAPARRLGNVMLEERLEKAAALERLRSMDAASKRTRRSRFGRSVHLVDAHDVTIQMGHNDVEQAAAIAAAAVRARGFAGAKTLPEATASTIQFDARVKLSAFGIAPAGRANAARPVFGHPSEEMFANLLDFYRIEWVYEPRSFPLQWDKNGSVTEAFTPDFYLPESDLYIELTTMKQSLVTRKNRKVKLLRAIYPHVNIQVFYQKDFQDLVFKYGWKAS